MHFIISVSTLPFTAQVMRKLRYFEYLYHDYFTVISIHYTKVNKWRENERIYSYYILYMFSINAQLYNVLLRSNDTFLLANY